MSELQRLLNDPRFRPADKTQRDSGVGPETNLGNVLRTLALPTAVAQWPMTTLRDRLVKIGARIVRHGRSVTFQMAEAMVSRSLFQQILAAIAALRPTPPARC